MSGDSGLDGIAHPHKDGLPFFSISAADLAKLTDDVADLPPVGDDTLVLVPYSLLSPEQLAQAMDPRRPFIEVEPSDQWTIAVYLDDGLVFEYEVSSMASAREHAAAIQTNGYRSVSKATRDVATYYPVHRIRKIKVTGPSPMSTAYTDTARGT